jgi:hypothetical protein
MTNSFVTFLIGMPGGSEWILIALALLILLLPFYLAYRLIKYYIKNNRSQKY